MAKYINHRIWARNYLVQGLVKHTQYPQNVNVWTGILGNEIIGSYFIEGNFNSEK